MKKIILWTVIGMLIGMFGFVYADEINTFVATKAGFKILVNGTEYTNQDKPVVVINGSTYMPLRALGEVLGVKVNWNADKKIVEVGKSETIPYNDVDKTTLLPTSTPIPQVKNTVAPINNSKKTTEDKINNEFKDKYQKLSDKTIQEAIDNGKEGKNTDDGYMDYNEYENDEGTENIAFCQILTPYQDIASASKYYYDKLIDFSVNDAKSYIADFNNNIKIEVILYGNYENYLKEMNAVIQQGDKRIQPLKIDCGDSNVGYVYYDINNIDFTRKANLIIAVAGYKIICDLDFNQPLKLEGAEIDLKSVNNESDTLKTFKYDNNIFRKVNWDMTKDEVIKAENNPQLLKLNDVNMLKFDNVNLVNMPFDITYFFENGKLNKIQADYMPKMTGRDDIFSQYKKTKKMLISEYGVAKTDDKKWLRSLGQPPYYSSYEDVGYIETGDLEYLTSWNMSDMKIDMIFNSQNYDLRNSIVFTKK